MTTPTPSSDSASTRHSHWQAQAMLCGVSLVLAYYFVGKITIGLWFSDFYGHIKLLYGVLTHQVPWPAHIGFYGLTAVAAGFSTDPQVLKIAGTVVVSLALLAKFWITFAEGRDLAGGSVKAWWWTFICLVLNFSFALPNPWLKPFTGQYCIGNVSPNVWHNSTTMLLMPFAMLQFISAYRWLAKGSRRDLLLTLSWGLLALIVKPSYLLAFLPAFGLMVLWQCRTLKQWIEASFLCGLLFAVLMAQKSVLHQDGSMSQVEIGFLKIWRDYHGRVAWPDASIALSFITCLLLPLSAIWWQPRLARDLLVRFASLQFAVALLISMVLNESGSRMVHGNFAWQIVVCCFLLYWSVGARAMAAGMTSASSRGKLTVVVTLASLHLLSGLVYLVRAIVYYTFV